MRAESFVSAAERFSIRAPPETGLMLESFAQKNPFTNTRRWPDNLVNAASSSTLVSVPFTETSFASWKFNFSIGATLVKRQSSSLNFGKPWSAKLAMPALRNGASHFGCVADSICENFPTSSSVPLFVFCVIFNFQPNSHFSMQSSPVQAFDSAGLHG